MESTQSLFADDPNAGAKDVAGEIEKPKAAPRVLMPNRGQLEFHASDLESLLPEGHRARIVWGYVERQNLEGLYAGIKAVEGGVGRCAIAPGILFALWLYATLEGVGGARAIARLALEHDAYRWICGGVQVNDHQISCARDFLVDKLKKLLKKNEDLKVHKFALINDARFSKRDTSSILVLSGDLNKRGWTPGDISSAHCTLLRYRDQIQANGETAFVVLVAPDKLTAYHPDLVDQSLPAGVIDEIADPPLVMPRVDRALRKAIEAGEIDVYLPGDSHGGAVGHKIVGDIMVETVTSLEGR